MKTLFISTYNEIITIGLLDDGKLVDEVNQESHKSHSIYLIPIIKGILKNNNIDTSNLNEIQVINGPGSFTGIRLGITVAKTLAYTLNIPIKTITSIEAIAASNNYDKLIVSIKDNKGKYLGIFNNNKLVNDLLYLSNNEYEEYLKNYSDYEIIENNTLDLERIYSYLKYKEPVNPHSVKAVYIKGIEALNDK